MEESPHSDCLIADAVATGLVFEAQDFRGFEQQTSYMLEQLTSSPPDLSHESKDGPNSAGSELQLLARCIRVCEVSRAVCLACGCPELKS